VRQRVRLTTTECRHRGSGEPASYHSKESSRSAPMRLTRPAIAVSGSRPNARTVRSSSLSAGPIPGALGPGSGRCCSAIVAEFKYLTWTDENLLRQVVYEVLREDKPAAEVRRSGGASRLRSKSKRERSSAKTNGKNGCRIGHRADRFRAVVRCNTGDRRWRGFCCQNGYLSSPAQ
jgi:hypothetical protein